MKRFTFLLAVAALSVGCTSRIPSGFNPLASGNGGSGGPDSIDTRSANARRDAVAAMILSGNPPPEAILTTVYFDFDKYTVSATERAKIDAVAGRVKATDIIIAGYTDISAPKNTISGCPIVALIPSASTSSRAVPAKPNLRSWPSVRSMRTRTLRVASPAPRIARRSSSTSTTPVRFPPRRPLGFPPRLRPPAPLRLPSPPRSERQVELSKRPANRRAFLLSDFSGLRQRREEVGERAAK